MFHAYFKITVTTQTFTFLIATSFISLHSPAALQLKLDPTSLG